MQVRIGVVHLGADPIPAAKSAVLVVPFGKRRPARSAQVPPERAVVRDEHVDVVRVIRPLLSVEAADRRTDGFPHVPAPAFPRRSPRARERQEDQTPRHPPSKRTHSHGPP